ncbi:MAG: AMP-binding protein [Phaeodactylibacter sp.]|nr:AMP-binding protein [Phaeodactylibacter sp.]MCB9293031.1 AMP-binding protein [Lewinellaceae bacterium]
MKEQLSYASGICHQPLIGKTIGDFFDEIVELYPDNEALVVQHQDIRLTYRQLKHQVDTCARALIAAGVEKGERAGIWAPNCAEWTVFQYATAKIGAILVNINPSYRLHELEYALNQSGCRFLVLADQFKKSNYIEMLNELAPELATSEPGRLAADKLPHLKAVVHLGEHPQPGMWSWSGFLKKSEPVAPEMLAERQVRCCFDDPINIQYTSGTTGFPKGATLSHHNILNNGFFVAETMNFKPEDRLILPVPLYHCFGMVLGNLGCLTHGATVIYPSPGFEPEAVLRAAEQERATAIYGVPTMFIAELEEPGFGKYDLSSLRTGIMAGAPCPVEVMKKVKTVMHMPEIQIAYGMTETSPVSTQTRPGASLEKQVSTVGRVHPHLEIKIINPENQKVVPRGTTGELCTRGYSVMLGYWRDEAKTREAIDQARWMHSGDLAIMDAEGYINIVGRIKDMIIRGGENIYPREIEEFLFTHPKVSEVQVIGVPDEKYGEEVMAWIKLKEREMATEEEIKAYCRGNIAHYKIPRYIKFTESFPMTVTGKIRKIEMRQVSVEELGLGKEAKIEMA